MSNESENKLARRAEDKRADGAVDWTDAPRFTALGIAETWSVTVEAEGQRVLCISNEHVTGLDDARLEPFVPTIRSCAQHLLGFIGAAPVSSTAGAAKGGITSEESRSVSAVEQPTGDLTDEQFMELHDSMFPPILFERERVMGNVARFARAAIAAYLARQAQAEPVTEQQIADLLFEGDIVTNLGHGALINGDTIYASLSLLTRFANKVLAEVAPAGAQNAPPAAGKYWMVESASGAMWWDGRFLNRGIDPRHFTTDPNKAVRFPTRADAERITSQSSALVATEHVWIADSASAQNAEAIRNQADGVRVFSPTEQQYLDWCKRHDLPDHLSRDAFDDAVSLHLDGQGALQTGSANTQEGGAA